MSAASTPFRVFYIGLHPLTPLWAAADPVSITGVAKLDFVSHPSIYPGDLFFKLLYSARAANASLGEALILPLWHLFRPLSSRTFSRYTPLLSFLVRKRIPIIDTENEEELVKFIKQSRTDLVVVNSWGLLSNSVIASVSRGTLNIHPSRLPEYRGALPTLWSLKNGDTDSAVTFMLLGNGVDGGSILKQVPFQIQENATALSLEHEIDEVVQAHLNAVIKDYLEGTLEPVPQQGEGSATERYERYRKIIPTTERTKDVINKVLLYPYLEPFCYAFLEIGGARRYVRRATPMEASQAKAGQWRLSSWSTLSLALQDGTISFKLFRDLSFTDSLYFLMHPKGNVGI